MNVLTPPPAAIKILVSNNVAGGLIGKKGETITILQDQSGARIKLSQVRVRGVRALRITVTKRSGGRISGCVIRREQATAPSPAPALDGVRLGGNARRSAHYASHTRSPSHPLTRAPAHPRTRSSAHPRTRAPTPPRPRPQNSDFFPGTNERTVLVSGEPASVLMAQELIVQRIHEEAQRSAVYHADIEAQKLAEEADEAERVRQSANPHDREDDDHQGGDDPRDDEHKGTSTSASTGTSASRTVDNAEERVEEGSTTTTTTQDDDERTPPQPPPTSSPPLSPSSEAASGQSGHSPAAPTPAKLRSRDSTKSQSDSHDNAEVKSCESEDEPLHIHMLVRIVVPANSAGAIIGKQGANINQLKEDTGARIKLVSKEDSPVPSERIVSIHGTYEACVEVVGVIIEKMSEELELHKYQV